MISQQHTKSFNWNDYASEVLYDTAQDIVKEQADILKTYYNRRTGDLQSNLQSRPYHVFKSAGGVRLIISYLKTIRFLDLKKTGTGRRKKVYHPIYNKPLYGFLYGSAYPQLRFGFSQNIKERTIEPLKVAFKDPIKV